MQQRDHPRAALVDEAEFLLDPAADMARRTRKARRHPGLQGFGLLGAHLARTAAHVEAGQTFDAAPFEQFVPAADRVVVEEQNLGPLPDSSCRHPKEPRRWRVESRDPPPTRRVPARSAPCDPLHSESRLESSGHPKPAGRQTQALFTDSSMSQGIFCKNPTILWRSVNGPLTCRRHIHVVTGWSEAIVPDWKHEALLPNP